LRRVAIVAKGPTNGSAPWRDANWEIWGLPWVTYPRVDLMFDVHTQAFADCAGVEWFRKDTWHPTFMAEHGNVPTYCEPCRRHLFPAYRDYPLDAIKEWLPFHYLENSIAYQLAFAIHEEVDEIGMWGVHMWGSGEYQAERPSITYLVGLAQGRGIKVSNCPGSPLFMSIWAAGRYGVSPEKRFLG
jgi:hypothetical protein